MKAFYVKNFKTLLKDIKEYLHKWKKSHVHGLEDFNITKMTILPKLTYTFNVIPIKTATDFFPPEMEELFL